MKAKRSLSLLSNTDGVAAVEFALIAPSLIFMLLGVFDFCMYMYTAMNLENTARSSVEYVLQGGAPDNIMDEVIMQSPLQLSVATQNTLNIVSSDYVCTCADGAVIECSGGSCPTQGDYMRRYYQVTLDMDYTPVFIYPGLPDVLAMRGHAILRVN